MEDRSAQLLMDFSAAVRHKKKIKRRLDSTRHRIDLLSVNLDDTAVFVKYKRVIYIETPEDSENLLSLSRRYNWARTARFFHPERDSRHLVAPIAGNLEQFGDACYILEEACNKLNKKRLEFNRAKDREQLASLSLQNLKFLSVRNLKEAHLACTALSHSNWSGMIRIVADQASTEPIRRHLINYGFINQII